ncbi:MAG: hypothetical protein J0I86_04425 [Mesorhizobium sp.]|nr:hypothetical protein [Mesorhizobium sp.]
MLALLSGFNGYLAGAGAILIALVVTYVKGRLSGAQRERDKQAAEQSRATDIGHQVDNDVGALPPNQARKDLEKWSKH